MASKSAAVREILERNPNMKNVEIVKALEKKGIEIQAAQVSIVKKKFLESSGVATTKKQPRRVRRRLERQTIKTVEGHSESEASTDEAVPAATSSTPDTEVVTHTTTSAKASSVAALSTESLLRARRSFASFIKKLAEETGSTEVVDMLYTDIKKEINP